MWSGAAQAAAGILPEEWMAYRDRFVTDEGRVTDDGNQNISHSEGQGYGLLLAYLANNPADFEQIWSFTRTELLLRDDGLAAWKWEEGARPRITDPNNASDGDILIAYALALAGAAWQRPDYQASARQIVRAIATTSIFERDRRVLLRPAVTGFDRKDRPDGPVVNPSYWVFEAFPVFQEIEPGVDWARLADDGVRILRAAAFGPRGLPPEWLALGGRPAPAEGFPAEFGYNAVRIPLYVVRGGLDEMDLLKRLRTGMRTPEGGMATFDLASGAARDPLADAGYLIIPAMIDCVLEDRTIPQELTTFAPTLYYPSTLHLLALSHLRTELSQCM
jgi:endo-1,4-beta-D-glucanase Y